MCIKYLTHKNGVIRKILNQKMKAVIQKESSIKITVILLPENKH